MKTQPLSNNELTVLRALWSVDHPLSRPEILKKIPDNNWNPNSIHFVLNNLIRKGYVEVDGMVQCGFSYGRTYRATKTQGDYAAELALQALPEAPDDEGVLTVMSAMVKHKNVSSATIAYLEQMLDERRKELQQKELELQQQEDQMSKDKEKPCP